MKKLEFVINIHAPKKKVWETMLNPATYQQWVDVSWPGSYFQGKWKGGETLKFISPGQGGTAATITEFQLYDHVMAKHVAIVNPDGTLDTTSETAQTWIGTTERYSFLEKNHTTELKIEADTKPEWENMFTDGWPNALQKLKEMCER